MNHKITAQLPAYSSPISTADSADFFYYKDRLIPHHFQVIEEKFPTSFVRTHQHYILNLLHINTIDSRERMVYLHPKWQWQVPIAHRQHTAFLKHIEKL
ncbi:MAG: LytTR family transcriptional regulator DNA-binding domain-containing protein [Chitinophagales bacterium]